MAAERRLAGGDGFIGHRPLPSRKPSGDREEDGDLAQGFRDQGAVGRRVCWCSNDELPLTTEASTFEELVTRVLAIAPEIAAENGLAAPGDEIELRIVGERVQSVPVVAAA